MVAKHDSKSEQTTCRPNRLMTKDELHAKYDVPSASAQLRGRYTAGAGPCAVQAGEEVAMSDPRYEELHPVVGVLLRVVHVVWYFCKGARACVAVLALLEWSDKERCTGRLNETAHTNATCGASYSLEAG